MRQVIPASMFVSITAPIFGPPFQVAVIATSIFFAYLRINRRCESVRETNVQGSYCHCPPQPSWPCIAGWKPGLPHREGRRDGTWFAQSRSRLPWPGGDIGGPFTRVSRGPGRKPSRREMSITGPRWSLYYGIYLLTRWYCRSNSKRKQPLAVRRLEDRGSMGHADLHFVDHGVGNTPSGGPRFTLNYPRPRYGIGLTRAAQNRSQAGSDTPNRNLLMHGGEKALTTSLSVRPHDHNTTS